MTSQMLQNATKSTNIKQVLLELLNPANQPPKFRDYDSILTECINQRALREGQRLHAHMIKSRYTPSVYLATRFIVMYAKCGEVDDAREMLDGMSHRSVASWTAVISGYGKIGRGSEAMEVFARMMREGGRPNKFTLTTVLSACAKPTGFNHVKQVHSLAVKSNFETHVFVGSSLLDMYAKVGKINEARLIFDKLPEKDVVSCTAIISGYAQLGHDEEALKIFRLLQKEGRESNYVTFVSLLTALAGMSALDYGLQVHGLTIRHHIPSYIALQNSLIDMYSKCGSLKYSRRVFDGMSERTIVSWNSILLGYANHGLATEVIEIFELMQENKMKPDSITFMAVLSGCNHGGLAEKGLEIFNEMVSVHGVEPEIEHYSCVVDFIGRAGKIEDALDFLMKMPFQPTPTMWNSLLGACRFHRNVSVADHAAQNLFEMEPQNDSNYVYLSNIYAALGRWEDVFHVRSLMKEKEVVKRSGQSWITLQNTANAE